MRVIGQPGLLYLNVNNMTTKDYEAIAFALRFSQPSKIANPKGYKSRNEAWVNTVECVITELERNFDNFKKDKFIKSCNLK